MLVSIIVPVYNREQYLKTCIDSILSQAYKDLQVILVDDGSTDKSGEICDSYQKKDSRVIVKHTENHGVSHARNTGLKCATGDYIAFVDSDDTVDKNMFFEMVEAAKETGADIILSDLSVLSCGKNENIVVGLEPLRVYRKEEIQKDILPRFTFIGKENLALFAFYTKLYKREVIIDNNIFFDTSISYEEDKLFAIEALANCNSLYYIPKAYYKYDTSSGGLYSAFNKDSWIWYVNGYKKFNFLIDKYDIKNANKKYLADSFIYNISWFLYRSRRIKNRREQKSIQSRVVKDNEVKKICSETLGMLESFDKRIAKAILHGNRFFVITIINFVYSGKKDKLLKLLKRQ